MNTELQQDPMSWGARVGLVDVTPLQFSGEGAAASMRARSIQADFLSRYYGVRVPPITAEEETQIAGFLSDASADQKIGLIGIMGSGFGSDASAEVLERIAPTQPLFAHAAGLALQGQAQAQTARRILVGAELMKGDSRVPLEFENINPIIDTTLGDAFARTGRARGSVIEAAKAIYQTLAIARSEPTEFDEDEWEQALQMAAGGIVGPDGSILGGVLDTDFGRLVPPAPMTGGDFEDLIATMTDEDLIAGSVGGGPPTFNIGRVFTMEDLLDPGLFDSPSRLINSGNGVYFIEAPTGSIQGTGINGFYELDLSLLLPTLMVRRTEIAPADPLKLDTQDLSNPLELNTENLSGQGDG